MIDLLEKIDLACLQASPSDRAYLQWQLRWVQTARPEQVPPDDGWDEFGGLAGRGWGKTRVGSEWLGRVAYEDPQHLPRCVVAPTQNDVRFTCFEGTSGLLNVIPPECVLDYASGDLLLTLTTGATIRGFSAEKADRLRGPEHADAWCFSSGTSVTMGDGSERAIEVVEVGDFVMTRRGPRPVLVVRSRDAEVGCVAFSNGVELVGTADHPVYVRPQNGWTDFSQLRWGDEVCVIGASSGAAIAGIATATAITSAPTRASRPSAISPSTVRCGLQRMAQSLLAMTSTIATMIRTTIATTISSASRTAGTALITARRKLQPIRTGLRPLRSGWPALPVVMRFSESAALKPRAALDASCTLPRTTGAQSGPVGGVAPCSGRAPVTSAVSVVSTWRPTGLRTVHCLTVGGDAPEFFANGVLVHNCDELAAWGKDAEYTLDMLTMGLRIGVHPRILWTTTPRPTSVVRSLSSPKPGRIIVRGTTYDNRANLSDAFFDRLAKYEGTRIGRQELYGEIIDPEESGIIRRSWLKLWPADRPLPAFEVVMMSLDTAFTERTTDRKTGDPDPTACSVWGLFTEPYQPKNKLPRKGVMLLDAWEDFLGLPDLVRRVKSEMKCAYGGDEDRAVIKPMYGGPKPSYAGRKPDVLLIEDKGSGISLRQTLFEAGIIATAYNPGNADKLARLHIVSPVFAHRMVWIPESNKLPGKPRTWAEPLIAQLCSFTGEGSIKHDDHVDSTTQAMRVLMDKGYLKLVKEAKDEPPPPDPKAYANPYGQ